MGPPIPPCAQFLNQIGCSQWPFIRVTRVIWASEIGQPHRDCITYCLPIETRFDLRSYCDAEDNLYILPCGERWPEFDGHFLTRMTDWNLFCTKTFQGNAR